ncbi:hypothetical protein L484_022135 [Morus notabilis]|uniref:Retrotransposon Copia-like N-terminal domain-containing protein n=1 Tax=Morus notabilis TaxID=981085 RepID=W9QKR9_9ROSA|nr:hypothetical protein L484_022135 [Morus notabilis]
MAYFTMFSIFNYSPPVRLDGRNYLTWRCAVLPLIRAFNYEGFIFGTHPSPPKYLQDQPPIAQENGPVAPAVSDPMDPAENGPVAPEEDGPAANDPIALAENDLVAPAENDPVAPAGDGPVAPAENGPVAPEGENPDYVTWKCQDQCLYAWILSTLRVEILGVAIGTDTSQALWNALEEMVAQLSNTWTGLLQSQINSPAMPL